MAAHGDETVTFFEIDQPFCSRTYGLAPCAAVLGTTGSRKCYNTRATCQDAANYLPSTVTLRFSRSDQQGLMQYGPLLPCLGELSTTPAAINLGAMDRNVKALGQREVVQVTLLDFQHSDNIVDKYRTERLTGAASSPADPFDPKDRGTFWGKFLARNPYHSSYVCRVREGVVGQALEDMRTRTYVIDRISGPNDGQVSIVAKDAFSKVEAKNAVAPRASTGELLADITNSATSFTLSPAGIGNAEYPASGHVCIGSEVMSFTRAGDVMTVTRAALNTVADTHKQQDLVQVVLSYVSAHPHDVAYDLLVNYSSIDSGLINKPEWDLAAVDITDLYTARIVEPTPVIDLIGELSEQAGFTCWPDVSTGMIKFTALRAAASAETVNDSGWIKEKSLSVQRLVSRRVSQCWVYYGQVDPTKKLDEKRNFRSRSVNVDVSAEGDTQYGVPAIREIFSRWIPQFGRQAAQTVGERIVAMFRDPPIEAKFNLFIDKVDRLLLSRYFDLLVDEAQDDTGDLARTTHAVVELEQGEDEISVRSMQVKFANVPTGGGARFVYIENDIYNVNMRDVWDSLFSPPQNGQTATFVVESNVKVGSIDASLPAMKTGDWPVGFTLNLTIKPGARVQGKGGEGAMGRIWDGTLGSQPGNPGQNGGTALKATYAVNVNNQGKLWSGGGGAGSGALWLGFVINYPAYTPGGGGGAGFDPGAGGFGDEGNTPGQPGTIDLGGVGGTSSVSNGQGGRGGDPGEDGQDGASAFHQYLGSSPGGAKGLKGAAVDGAAFVTWVNIGDRKGILV